jgi:sugar-specific transcriptional regulator TrmB
MASDLVGVLRALGLTEQESRVYLRLLATGAIPAGLLAAKLGLHRRTVYDALESLRAKGLATASTTDKGKSFEAAPPQALDGLLDERKALLAGSLPELLKLSAPTAEGPQVRIFRGVDGLKAVFEDVLVHAKVLRVYAGGVQAADYLGDYFWRWNQRRAKRKILSRFIFIDTPEIRARVKKLSFAQTRPIPPQYYSNVVWWLYADKLVLLFWGSNLMAVQITGADIAKSYEYFFETIWKNAPKN